VISPMDAAPRLANLGFLASGGLAEGDGGGYLLVAIRGQPSRTHFDPERVEYWVTDSGRGSPRTLALGSRLPLGATFSWGRIRIIDRLGEENEYIGFGGDLNAIRLNDMIVAVFTSPAPLLVAGGHSQGGDEAAAMVGAFFGRLLVAIDYSPGLERRVSRADPVARYAAFLAVQNGRYRSTPSLRDDEVDEARRSAAEEDRIRSAEPASWAEGEAISRALTQLAGRGKG
jgi:hypothetical protein